MRNFLRYKLCELFGIPLYLDVSLIFLLVFFVMGGDFHRGFICAALLLASITAHELGHALTAQAFGYRTRDITLSLLGGCASIIALPRKAHEEFLTAIAGPLVSFALGMLGAVGIVSLAAGGTYLDALLMVISDSLGVFGLDVAWGDGIFVERGKMSPFLPVFLYFSSMNFILGFFNLLPGFPLDGGRVFRSVMRQFMSRIRATYIAMVVGRVVAVGIGCLGVYRILIGLNWGFVTVLIAWMIWKEGYREYQLARLESGWDFFDYRARASAPPYGGSGSESEVTRS